MKQSKDKITCRPSDKELVEQYRGKVEQLQDDIIQVYKMESCEKEMLQAEQQAARAQNMLRHQDEILNRPRKTWIVSAKQKQDLIDKQKKIRDDNASDDEEAPKSSSYEDLEEKLMGHKKKQNQNGFQGKNKNFKSGGDKDFKRGGGKNFKSGGGKNFKGGPKNFKKNKH